MKKINIAILLFVLLAPGFALYAQTQIVSEKELPEALKEAFVVAYPHIKASKWELTNQQYFAYIKTKETKEVARFFSDGTWIETRAIVENETLPLKAVDFLQTEYPAYYIYMVFYVEQKEGKPYYLIELNLKENKNVKVELSFDLAGKLSGVDGLNVIKNTDTNNTQIVINTQTTQNAIIAPERNAVPTEIELVFKKRFPRPENIFWSQEEPLYLVRFTMNDRDQEAAYLSPGIHVYTASFFDKKTLPLPIERYLSENHPKCNVKECKRVIYESKYKRTFTERPKDYFRVIITEKIPKSKEVKTTLLRFDQAAQFDYKTDYNGL
ncbi:MAG: hypothetical protein RR328_02065 [Bacteroidales bacterium]